MTESVSESSTAILSGLVTKGPMKVLHVDDDSGFLRIAKECLRMQGEFQVETVRCVEEAKDKLGREKYDVIVCDHQIPGKDGLEFLKELRKEGNNIPFIIFTGKGREEVAIKALNMGADGYFNKHGKPETVYGELAHGIRLAVERKTAEMKIWEREERLRAVLSSSPDAITVSDLHGNILDCNEAAWKMFGFSSREEVIGKSSFDFIAEKDRQKALQSLKKTLEQGTTRNVEYALLNKDGDEFWGELSASILRDSAGSPACFVGVIRDITERKRSETKLMRLASFPEKNPSPVLEIDLTGKTTYLNPAARKLLSQLHASKLSDGLEEDLKALIGEFNTRRTENFLRENVKIGDRQYEQSIYYVPKDAALRIFMVDITERDQAKKILRESEEKYRRLVENLQEGVWAIDKDSFTTFVNSRMAEILGYTVDEMLGKPLFAFMDERGIEIAKRLLERRAQGIRELHDFEFVKKDGTRIYATLATSPINDSNGNYIGALAGVIDITERRKAEQALKESEEKYRSLVELAPDGILAVNAEGIVTSANRSFLTLIGYDFEEIVGKPFTELKTMRMGDIPKFQRMFKSLIEGESPAPVEFLYARRDGTNRWAEVHPGLLIKDGNPAGLQVIMRDVSERKNAEKLIEGSQQKFEQLFRGNPEAAVYVDSNETVLDINQRFSDLFGYSPADIKGKSLDNFIVPENGRKEATMLSQKSGKGYLYHETVRRNKKGSLIPVAISAAPIVLHGQHLGDIVLYRDITERKKAEEEIREAMERLEMVNEKLRVVGGLTRHDVRNKLATVTGNAYLVRKKLPENSEVLDYVKMIEGSVEQSVRIFDFAKDYEMLGAEELLYVDVEKTVNGAVSLFPDLRDIKVTNDCHGLTVLADSLLRQLFYNLIDNSLKYGEKLSRIRIYFEEKNGFVNLIYEDNGVGIRPEAKPKLLHEGYTTGKGSGYGLYLIKKMMEVYGWAIKETGEPGKGALFIITIPKANEKGRINYKLH